MRRLQLSVTVPLAEQPEEVRGFAAILASYLVLSDQHAVSWAIMVLERHPEPIPSPKRPGEAVPGSERYGPVELEQACKAMMASGYTGAPEGRFAALLVQLRRVRAANIELAQRRIQDLGRRALPASTPEGEEQRQAEAAAVAKQKVAEIVASLAAKMTGRAPEQ